jgi:hypothetical protein
MTEDTHALERSNPKGQPFVGYCTKCGKTGLTFADMKEPCANPAGMTEGDALIRAIEGEER